MTIELDTIDLGIIRILQIGGRESNREIARRLDISEGTVRTRLRRLEQRGQFRLIVRKNPAAFGLPCMAYVRISVLPAHADEFARALFRQQEILSISVTLHSFNILAITSTDSRDTLDSFLEEHVMKMRGAQEFEVYEEVATLLFGNHWTI